MRKTAVGYAIGKFLQVLGFVLVVPLSIAVYDNYTDSIPALLTHPEVYGFIIAILLSVLMGTIMVLWLKEGKHLQGIKEGYAIVTFGWLGLTLLSSIPLLVYFLESDPLGWSNLLTHFTNAYFEIMSGFTTTGATILTDIEAMPRSLLFLRALTHWLGGMGIITLAIAIFPAMGVSGYQMFRGEVPGPTAEKLQPRLAQTASILWGVYVLFTGAETVLLMVGGMNLFDAVCHSFATMATGGFSTKNASIAAYDSDFIHWVITFFMFLAGVNFLLHFRAIRGNIRSMFRDKEFVFYTGIVVSTIIIMTAVLYINGLDTIDETYRHFRVDKPSVEEFTAYYNQQEGLLDSFYSTLKTASFQTLAIVTTTGFATADFDLWPNVLRNLLVILMFFGGCAGSTGGGMKMIRIMIVFKTAVNEIKKLTQPRLILPVKVGGQAIDDRKVVNIASFVILFIILFVITALLMTLFVPDLTTAITCSAATIGNIGPGLSGVGAVENYAWIPLPGKWILVISMLLGRLEIFTVLIMFRPAVWRK